MRNSFSLIKKITLFALILVGSNSCSTATHTVTFDSDGGSIVPSQSVKHGGKVKKPDDPIKEGHHFMNWTYNNEYWSFDEDKVIEDMTLLARWNANKYSLKLNNSDPTRGSVSGAGTYTYNSDVQISATPKQGYSFDGWYDSKDSLVSNLSPYSFKMGLDLTLTAKWASKQNILSVISEDESKGTVSIKSGSGYSGESITVVATPSSDYAFKNWTHDDIVVSYESNYTFIMPNNDYSLVAHFFTLEEEKAFSLKYATKPILNNMKQTITYGLYPQTKVENESIISNLDKVTDQELNGWYLYDGDYYNKGTWLKWNGSSYVNETGWFKCEPIVWKILNKSGLNKYTVLSSVTLDNFNYSSASTTRDIDGKTIYPNNYQYSDIRTWLNNDFYKSAFGLGNGSIQVTSIDNSASTTNSSSNTYASQNTKDKVFLPSFKDYTDSGYGFDTSAGPSNTRTCEISDWAMKNIYDNPIQALYWTRSPYSQDQSTAWIIKFDGGFAGAKVTENRGVRTAITLTIN